MVTVAVLGLVAIVAIAAGCMRLAYLTDWEATAGGCIEEGQEQVR
jgi:hypothetical protein